MALSNFTSPYNFILELWIWWICWRPGCFMVLFWISSEHVLLVFFFWLFVLRGCHRGPSIPYIYLGTSFTLDTFPGTSFQFVFGLGTALRMSCSLVTRFLGNGWLLHCQCQFLNVLLIFLFFFNCWRAKSCQWEKSKTVWSFKKII